VRGAGAHRGVGAGGVHLVKNVVGGAVDDAEHAGDAVAGHGLAQRVDHRDGAGCEAPVGAAQS